MTLENVKIVDPPEQGDLPEFWKPISGKHKVLFLEDGSVRMAKMKDEEQEMFYIRIEVDKTEYTWSTRYRVEVTDASILGQLKKIEQKFGTLAGVTADVIISGTGRQKRYFIDVDSATKKAASAAPPISKIQRCVKCGTETDLLDNGVCQFCLNADRKIKKAEQEKLSKDAEAFIPTKEEQERRSWGV